MSDLGRFFKHSSIYAIGNMVNRIGAFLLLPVYTNYLTVGEYGSLEMFYVVMSVASGFLAVGMAHATLRFYFDYERLEDRQASVSTNFIGSFLVTITGISILAAFSPELSRLVFDDTALVVGFYLIFATIVFELSSQICLAYVRAIEYSVFFVVISFLKLLLQVSLNSYLVIVHDAGIVGVLAGNLCTVILGWVILAGFTLRRCGIRFEWEKFLPIVRYCLPFLPATLASLVAANANQYFLSTLLSFEALGLFALAIKFSLVIEQLIGEPFSRSYGAFRYTIMNKGEAAELQARIVRYLMVATAFSALGIALLAEDLIRVMSDQQYWPASDLVPLMMVYSALKILEYPAQTGILYAKQTKYLFYLTAVAGTTTVVTSFLMISFVGLYGACISLIVTEALTLYLTGRISRRFFQVEYEYRKLGLVVLLVTATYLLGRMYVPDAIILSVCFKFLLLGLFAGSIVIFRVISADELASAWTFVAARSGKGQAGG